MRYGFGQEGEALLGDTSSHIGVSGDVATWSRQTCHEARADRIRDWGEDDGDRACRPLSRQRNRGCRHDEHIDLEVEQFGNESWNSLIAVREAWFDDNIRALDIAVFPKRIAECGNAGGAARP